MVIVGCDFHPSWQQVAIFDPATGEMGERKLVNRAGQDRTMPLSGVVISPQTTWHKVARKTPPGTRRTWRLAS
jgi:hypothetical protein